MGRALNPRIVTVATNRGAAESVIAIHPELARRRIREGVEQAFSGDLAEQRVALPERFEFRLQFKHHSDAYARSFYPNAWLEDEETVAFDTDDFFEVLRILRFMR